MLLTQQHLGVAAEHFTCHFVRVLRADGQHDSASPEVEGHALYGQVCLASRVALRKHDAGESIVADDATPEGIVEVEHQNTATLSAHRRGGSAHMIRVQRNEGLREGKLGQIPLMRVVPLGQAHRLRNCRDVQQHVRAGSHPAAELAVEAVEQPSPCARQRSLEAAEQRLRRWGNSRYDRRRLAVRGDRLTGLVDERDGPFDGGGTGIGVTGGAGKRQRSPIEAEDHQVGLRRHDG